MQRQGRKHTHACPHTTPTGPRACGGEHTVAGTPAAEGQVAGRAGGCLLYTSDAADE